MTKEELFERYNFEESIDDITKRQEEGKVLNPIYEKHLPAAWIIQNIWGHAAMENISLGKARELTTAVIEEHINNLKQKSL